MTHDPDWLIHRYDSVASTMEVRADSPGSARGSALSSSVPSRPPDAAAVADLAGRGGKRGLRHPHSAAAGCGHRLSTLPLIAGVAVAEAIERIAGCSL